MKNRIHSILVLFILSYSQLLNAEIIIEGSSDFQAKVRGNLAEARTASTHLAKLILNAERTPAKITIKPITDDRSTWHKSGKKSRSHTKALDNKRRGAERDSSTDSIIYINRNRITRSHKTYKSGTLIHEIVHALDLANGNYHGRYPLREKRAVFFQNIWRDKQVKKLRSDYHGRFKTIEYQNAKKARQVNFFVDYYFENNDIP
ncbi:MAG: M91 family zinc metallopeptidase [Candidatus Thiodiazotropha sp.]